MADDNHSNGSINLHQNDLTVIERALNEITDVSLALKGLASGIYDNADAQTNPQIMAMATATELLAGKAGWLVDICLERLGKMSHGYAESWLMPEGCRVFVPKMDKGEVAHG